MKKVKKEFLKKIKPYWPLLVGNLLLISFFATAYEKDEQIELPENIMGEWTTTSPKYADRFFALEKRLITIGTGKDNFEVHIISNIKMSGDNRGESYSLTYYDAIGIKYEFTFHYFPNEVEGGAIRIKNRNDIVWVKKEKNTEEAES